MRTRLLLVGMIFMAIGIGGLLIPGMEMGTEMFEQNPESALGWVILIPALGGLTFIGFVTSVFGLVLKSEKHKLKSKN